MSKSKKEPPDRGSTVRLPSEAKELLDSLAAMEERLHGVILWRALRAYASARYPDKFGNLKLPDDPAQ